MGLRTGVMAPLAIAVVIVFGSAAGAPAAPIAFQFSTTIDATVIGGSPVAPFVLTYIFDSDLADGTGTFVPGPDAGSYGPISGTLQVGSETVTLAAGPSPTGIGVLNDVGAVVHDEYLVRFGSPGAPSPATSGTIGGYGVLHVYADLFDDQATMFGNKNLPVSTAFASEADRMRVEVWLGDDPIGLFPEAELHISPAAPLKSFSLVQVPVSAPEPGVAVLIGVAIAGIAARRRSVGMMN